MVSPNVQIALDDLNKALLNLDSQITEMFGSDDAEVNDVVATIVAVHELKSGMGDVYASLCGKSVLYFSQREIDDIELDGHRIEVRSAVDRKKWDHGKLIDAVAKRLVESSIDLDTGEMTITPQEMAHRIMEFVQPSYWRVKELSKVGLNPDSFCEVGENKTNLIVRKAK